jgi:hypothetical protein
VDNRLLAISRLTPDLANTTGGVCAALPQSEAPALFKHEGRYYLLASHLTGWWAAGLGRAGAGPELGARCQLPLGPSSGPGPPPFPGASAGPGRPAWPTCSSPLNPPLPSPPSRARPARHAAA